MNKFFISGFLKAAAMRGYADEKLEKLLKTAGRGALLSQMFKTVGNMVNRAPASVVNKTTGAMTSTAPKLDKLKDTFDTAKALVGPQAQSIAPRLPVTPGAMRNPQADYLRLLRSRMKEYNSLIQ